MAVTHEDEIRDLRAELRKQWELNHAEHCQWDWPHEGDCHYPPPEILETANRDHDR